MKMVLAIIWMMGGMTSMPMTERQCEHLRKVLAKEAQRPVVYCVEMLKPVDPALRVNELVKDAFETPMPPPKETL